MENGLMKTFFTSDSFALFAPSKWKDLLFNKQRMEVKESLKNITAAIEAAIEELAADFTMELGSETPAIWNNRLVDRLEMFHIRPENDRVVLSKAFSREMPMSLMLQAPSPLYAHASLGLIIREDGLEVGWRLPFLAFGDIEVLRQEIAQSPSDIDSMLASLPVYLQFISPDGTHRLASSLNHSDLIEYVDGLRVGAGTDHRNCLSIVRQWEPSTYSETDDDFIQGILAVYRSLLPLYQRFSWSSDRDQLDIAGLVATQDRMRDEERRQREEEAKAAKLKEESERMETRERMISERRERLTPVRREERPQSKPVEKIARPPIKSPEAPREKPRREKPAHDKRQPKVTNAAPAPRGKDHFASGEVVILMSGLLCGKQGVIVGQASAKNHYRVKVGAMEVTVDTADLRPAT